MLKLLHISDIHLGANLKLFGDKATVHREQIRKTLEQACKQAQELKVSAAIITGDVFDHFFPSEDTANSFLSAVKPLLQAGIYVVVLPGNHDRLEQQSIWYALGAEIKAQQADKLKVIGLQGEEIESLRLPEINLTVLGRGTYTQKSKQSPLRGMAAAVKAARVSHPDDFVVVMAHGSVSLAQEADNYPISKEEIASLGADYLALGDWHGRLDVSQGEQSAHYPGALEFLNSDQENSGGGLVVSLAKGQKPQVNWQKFSPLALHKLELNLEQQGIENLLQQISAQASKNTILQVNLVGNLKVDVKAQLDLEKLQIDLENKCYLLRLNDKTGTTIDFTSFTNFPKGSLPEGFVAELEAKVKSGEIPADLAADVLNLGLRTILS